MHEWQKQAFAFAQDVTKQLITLATGVVALTITFVKDFATGAGPGPRAWLGVSWVLYLASVVAGLWTLMALTGALHHDQDAASVAGKNVTWPAMAQVVLFAAALVVTVVAGWQSL